MILSRLLLNPRSRDVRRDLADAYQLHRTVMSGFPKKMPEGERVLFRVDESVDGRRALLVQSRKVRPDWSGLPEDYLLPADPFDPLPNPVMREDALTFRAGQVLRFRLRANPTVKKPPVERPADGKGQGRRVAIVREEAQVAWLERKGTVGGFRPLEGVRVVDMGRAFGLARRTPPTSDPAFGISTETQPRTRLELNVIQFDGLLEVTDPERFAQTLSDGIGSAKGFGCGMLSLGRA